MRRVPLLCCAVASAVLPCGVLAHHEAIFGPQSSLVLSAPGFVSIQTFTRQTGTSSDRTQETTALASGAFTPFSFPLSFSIIAPVSHVAQLDQGGSRTASENIILGARYRLDPTSRPRRQPLQPSGGERYCGRALHRSPGAIR